MKERSHFNATFANTLTSQKQHLQTHIESVHQGNRFNCQTCDSNFSDEMSLIKHIVLVH